MAETSNLSKIAVSSPKADPLSYENLCMFSRREAEKLRENGKCNQHIHYTEIVGRIQPKKCAKRKKFRFRFA